MIQRFAKLLMIFLFAGGMASTWALDVYADNKPHPHIHILSRVRTPNGQPVQGAVQRNPGSSWLSTPNGPIVLGTVRFEGGGLTNAQGESEIIVVFDRDLPCPLDQVEVNAEGMRWEKQGYTIEAR